MNRPQLKTAQLSELTREDLEEFQEALKAQGLKTNTRRRKLLTVKRMLSYLDNRNKLPESIAHHISAPQKIERIPLTIDSDELLFRIRALPIPTEIDARNQLLLWTLAETGLQVSEASQVRFEDWSAPTPTQPILHIQTGKSPRDIPVSPELYQAVQKLVFLQKKPSDWMFLGFNKFGSMGTAITPRGIELLVRSYSQRLEQPKLTPRTFRHSAVLHWYKQGVSVTEIQKRLGLKTAYAFRAYEPLLKAISKTEATSSP